MSFKDIVNQANPHICPATLVKILAAEKFIVLTL